jgi:hypothetical protein
MNLTGQPVYTKGQQRKSRGRPPNAAERTHWENIRRLGCSVCRATDPEIHHCGTGGGGRKDHLKVIPLCNFHHRGPQGIHTLSRKVWEPLYGTEAEHLARVASCVRLLRVAGRSSRRSP